MREVFLGKNQIRKVQRTDKRGGGEESWFTTREKEFWTGGAATKTFDAIEGTAATEKLPAQVCPSGTGASDATQQVLLPAEILTPVSSGPVIPIRSQSVFVCGVTQSPACECAIAQAEAGREPSPVRPSATMKLRILRIFNRTESNCTTPAKTYRREYRVSDTCSPWGSSLPLVTAVTGLASP